MEQREQSGLAAVAQILFIMLAAGAVYLFVSAAQNDQRRSACTALCAVHPDYAARDRTAPDFELPDMTGKKVRLSSYRGKTVLLHFWSRTCKPCLYELPVLAEFAKSIASRGDIAVVTVSTDEGPEVVRDELKVAVEGELPFSVLFDPDMQIVGDKYGTRLYPETWVIDPKGVIRARFDGPRDWSASIVLEVAEMVARPAGCPVEFFKGQPRGPFAGMCEEER